MFGWRVHTDSQSAAVYNNAKSNHCCRYVVARSPSLGLRRRARALRANVLARLPASYCFCSCCCWCSWWYGCHSAAVAAMRSGRCVDVSSRTDGCTNAGLVRRRCQLQSPSLRKLGQTFIWPHRDRHHASPVRAHYIATMQECSTTERCIHLVAVCYTTDAARMNASLRAGNLLSQTNPIITECLGVFSIHWTELGESLIAIHV